MKLNIYQLLLLIGLGLFLFGFVIGYIGYFSFR